MDLSFATQSDDKIKRLVFGFIRKSIPTQSIPMVINYLCVLYYLIKEKFNKIAPNDMIEILSKENILHQYDTIKYKSKHDKLKSTIFGCFNIDFATFCNHVLIWNFDIKCNELSIGIQSYLNNKIFKYGNKHYQFYSDGRLSSDGVLDLNDDVSFGIGDIIRMELNTSNKSLKFYKNCKQIGVEFDNIKTSNRQYRMFIELSGYGSIKLLNFKIMRMSKK